jgi:hypothetical protein
MLDLSPLCLFVVLPTILSLRKQINHLVRAVVDQVGRPAAERAANILAFARSATRGSSSCFRRECTGWFFPESVPTHPAPIHVDRARAVP